MTLGNADGETRRPSQAKGGPAKGDYRSMTNSLDVGLGDVPSHTPLPRSAGRILLFLSVPPALTAPTIIKAAISRARKAVNVTPTFPSFRLRPAHCRAGNRFMPISGGALTGEGTLIEYPAFAASRAEGQARPILVPTPNRHLLDLTAYRRGDCAMKLAVVLVVGLLALFCSGAQGGDPPTGTGRSQRVSSALEHAAGVGPDLRYGNQAHNDDQCEHHAILNCGRAIFLSKE